MRGVKSSGCCLSVCSHTFVTTFVSKSHSLHLYFDWLLCLFSMCFLSWILSLHLNGHFSHWITVWSFRSMVTLMVLCFTWMWLSNSVCDWQVNSHVVQFTLIRFWVLLLGFLADSFILEFIGWFLVASRSLKLGEMLFPDRGCLWLALICSFNWL